MFNTFVFQVQAATNKCSKYCFFVAKYIDCFLYIESYL